LKYQIASTLLGANILIITKLSFFVTVYYFAGKEMEIQYFEDWKEIDRNIE